MGQDAAEKDRLSQAREAVGEVRETRRPAPGSPASAGLPPRVTRPAPPPLGSGMPPAGARMPPPAPAPPKPSSGPPRLRSSIPPGPSVPGRQAFHTLQSHLQAVRAMVAKHERVLEAVRSRVDLLNVRLGEVEEEAPGDPSAAGLTPSTDRLEQLETRVVALETRAIAETPAQEADSARDQPSVLEARLGMIEERLGALERASHEDELARARDRLDHLEQKLLELGNRRASSSSKLPQDALEHIRGIGPAFARALREAGVVTVADVASWSEAEVEAFAEKLGISPQRIRRQQWVESARNLAQQLPSS